MVGEFENDPRAPVFFLSYSRPRRVNQPLSAPREPSVHIRRIFEDLTANVNELIGSAPGQDPGYLDLTMDGGERWKKRILRAAGTCQVFICLLSTPYLNRSEWCAMEWDIFSRRKVIPRGEGGADEESAIVPVLWAPIRHPLPSIVAEVNLFSPSDLPDPDFTARYRADGLLGLLKTRQDAIYEAIVWKLAMHVQKLHSSYWVKPDVPTGTDGLRRSFGKGEA